MPIACADVVKHAHALILVGGRYALQLRDEGIADAPGMWGMFGGEIDAGESPYMAIVREIREELELDASGAIPFRQYGNSQVFVFDATDQWDRHVLHEGQAARLFDVEPTLPWNLAPYVGPAILDWEKNKT